MFHLRQFWVVGTDTDVGKTIVTSLLVRNLQQRGFNTVPFKPVQTGEIVEKNHCFYYDTSMYERFSLQALRTEDMNIYSFKVAASPHFAAQLEGVTMDTNLLLNKIATLQKAVDVLVIEGAGGLYVPLVASSKYTLLDLIKQSGLPVVLVTRTKLGTINHTMLALDVLKNWGIETLGLIFNGNEGTAIEEDNMAVIIEHSQLPYATIPKFQEIDQLINYSIENSSLFERLLNI